MGCIFSKKRNNNILNTNINDKNLKIYKKSNINILYLEDVEIHYDLLTFILHTYIDNNINIIWKKTVNECYDYLENNQIDLIFVDRLLKNEMGDDLITKIKNNNIFPLNKIIIISAINKVDEIQKFVDMGLFYFKKPLNTAIFIRTMKNVFNSI